ncbi:tetratricopeptide repeat protein [Marinicella gelatinilytica]|uniref:tetratricopeptide repeat protein n=1 Tax=Marinicella gelatinilytica TaxID=2996017 RepID=UPI002260B9FA|nr:tetratricopeptide repeat protein [Marinicella gelatinilytica]MCX7543966.1 tetratricopeptide repeat protein [Marinicella gelatinilytica]
MTPWLIYSTIILALALIFGFLMWGQNKRQSKRWLIQKIKQDTEQKDRYIQALNKLDTTKSQALKTTLVLFIFMVPGAILLNSYLFPAVNHDLQQPPSIEEAIGQLEQALQQNPNDLEGQMLYARAMMSMQNFSAAVKSLRKANELSPNNANILTELAEAVAFQNNTGSFLGEPESFIEAALIADPQHQKALWLKGIIAFENQEYTEAEQLWTTLFNIISDEKVKATIIKQINQARSQQNKSAVTHNDLTGNMNAQTDQIVSYSVTVEASEDIKNQQFPATTRVFVAAKAMTGPPMPIAAIDLAPPFQWPLKINLTNQHNLTPNRQLSDFEEIVITARLSVSGDAGVSDYISQDFVATSNQPDVTVQLSTP